MRLPSSTSLHRRDAVSGGLLALLSTTLSSTALFSSPGRALAAYTVIPSGTIVEKQARLKEVEKLFAKSPDDPYVFGERAQLQYDIGALESNGRFAKQLSQELAEGTTAFPQSLSVQVPNMEEALTFWRSGVGCLMLGTTIDADGANVTRLAFGSQSLKRDDGAKFTLELVQPKGGCAPFSAEKSSLQYLQLALPQFRLSQVMNYGGAVVSAYGWTEAVAPGGLPLRVRIDETQRDPFEVRPKALPHTASSHSCANGTLLLVPPVRGPAYQRSQGLDAAL